MKRFKMEQWYPIRKIKIYQNYFSDILIGEYATIFDEKLSKYAFYNALELKI